MSKVNKGYALDVREAVIFLRANYAERKAPADYALARARALLNSAERQVEPPAARRRWHWRRAECGSTRRSRGNCS
jgi:hypothetical protein